MHDLGVIAVQKLAYDLHREKLQKAVRVATVIVRVICMVVCR